MVVLLSQVSDKLWDNGIAVGCLMLASILIWKLISIGADKFEKVSERHSESMEKVATTMESMQTAHREERKEWKAEAKTEADLRIEDSRLRDARITEVCDQLIKAIHKDV